jgi:hypothetical protein
MVKATQQFYEEVRANLEEQGLQSSGAVLG